jgi:hypothetical protein
MCYHFHSEYKYFKPEYILMEKDQFSEMRFSELREELSSIYEIFLKNTYPPSEVKRLEKKLEIETDVMAYLAARCIQERNIGSTTIKSTDLFRDLEKKYSVAEIRNVCRGLCNSGMINSRWVYAEEIGWITGYWPALSIRMLCTDYLERHPEITDIKDAGNL